MRRSSKVDRLQSRQRLKRFLLPHLTHPHVESISWEDPSLHDLEHLLFVQHQKTQPQSYCHKVVRKKSIVNICLLSLLRPTPTTHRIFSVRNLDLHCPFIPNLKPVFRVTSTSSIKMPLVETVTILNKSGKVVSTVSTGLYFVLTDPPN